MTAARATPADAAAVVDLVRSAALALAARGIDQWAYYTTDAGAAVVRRRIDDHDVYLFRDAGLPVATLCLQWADADYWGDRGTDGLAGYVHQLAVSPTAAGRGVGAAAIKWAAEAIVARGRRFFRLDCLAENRRLCDYYRSRGFAPAGTVTMSHGLAQRFERDLRPG